MIGQFLTAEGLKPH